MQDLVELADRSGMPESSEKPRALDPDERIERPNRLVPVLSRFHALVSVGETSGTARKGQRGPTDEVVERAG
jgi:hypothetical protein